MPGCLSMNWRRDGVAACRPAGSHPPAASASPLWHARHPLARGPRPAIPSQGSNQVCRPADSVVTLLRDTDSVPRVTGEISCKPSDRVEWGAHRGCYKPASCMKASNSFAWVTRAVTGGLDSVMPMAGTAWPRHARSGSG